MTVYEYINEEWTRVTDRVGCTEIPEWNQESQTRILVFAPGDAVIEDEAEAEVPGENPPDGGGDDADDHPPDGEEKADEEEHEEIAEETQPDEPFLDPPEAGHETTYYANDSSCLAKDPEHAPSGDLTRGRALSDDSSVVGPYQTVDQVGEHPACAVDPSQEREGQPARVTFPNIRR